jgi:hypothetical protein
MTISKISQEGGSLVQENDGRRSIRDLQVRLADYLIQMNEGDRLPSIRQLAASTHMSVGSVSTALNALQDMGAVKIQNHGHQGSEVVSLSLNRLWNLVEQGPLVISMTLPMHTRFEGLATGIKQSLEKAGFETYLIFIRGSRTRLKALRENRCHVTVMSGLAAEELCGEDQEIVLQLPPGSWISDYGVYYRESESGRAHPLRLAVDRDSYDHRRLSELEFEHQDVELHWVPFIQIPRLLRNGEIDATVWTVDQAETYLSPGVVLRPLSDRVMAEVGAKSTSATFVGRKGSHSIRAVLQAAIDPAQVMEIQSKIISGKLIPEY